MSNAGIGSTVPLDRFRHVLRIVGSQSVEWKGFPPDSLLSANPRTAGGAKGCTHLTHWPSVLDVPHWPSGSRCSAVSASYESHARKRELDAADECGLVDRKARAGSHVDPTDHAERPHSLGNLAFVERRPAAELPVHDFCHDARFGRDEAVRSTSCFQAK